MNVVLDSVSFLPSIAVLLVDRFSWSLDVRFVSLSSVTFCVSSVCFVEMFSFSVLLFSMAVVLTSVSFLPSIIVLLVDRFSWFSVVRLSSVLVSSLTAFVSLVLFEMDVVLASVSFFL